MHTGIPKSVLLLCLASMALAHGMPPVPLDGDGLVSGRNILISVSGDTLETYVDSPAVRFVKTRSVVFRKRSPQDAYDEFRMMGMDFSEFTILGRSGDSLFVTTAPKKSRDRASYYPLCIRMGGLMRIYDAKEAPENSLAEAAAEKGYSELRPRLEFALAGAGLGLLLGTGLAMQLSQARDEPFDASFRRSSLYGGLGALLGIVVVVQLTDF